MVVREGILVSSRDGWCLEIDSSFYGRALVARAIQSDYQIRHPGRTFKYHLVQLGLWVDAQRSSQMIRGGLRCCVEFTHLLLRRL